MPSPYLAFSYHFVTDFDFVRSLANALAPATKRASGLPAPARLRPTGMKKLPQPRAEESSVCRWHFFDNAGEHLQSRRERLDASANWLRCNAGWNRHLMPPADLLYGRCRCIADKR